MTEQCHKRISKMDFLKEMKQHTLWWQNSTTKGSAEWISKRRHNYSLSGSRIAPHVGQHDGFLREDKITHKLVIEQCHKESAEWIYRRR